MKDLIRIVSRNLDTILCWFLLVLPPYLAVYGGLHPPDGLGHAADFAIFRTAAEIVRSGQGDKLYDIDTQKRFYFKITEHRYPVFLVWNHHPAEALLYLPTVFATYETGLFVMRITNIILMCSFITWVAWRLRANSGHLFLLWVVLMIGTRSFACAIQGGQDSIWILLFVVLGLVAASEGKPRCSGILLVLASIKFTIVLPLMGILLLARFCKVVWYSAAVGVALMFVAMAVFGAEILPSYLTLCVALTSIRDNFGMYPALLRNFRGMLMRWFPGSTNAMALSAGCGALYALVCTQIQRPYVLPLALFGATFFSPHVFLHDTVMYVGSAAVWLVIWQSARAAVPSTVGTCECGNSSTDSGRQCNP